VKACEKLLQSCKRIPCFNSCCAYSFCLIFVFWFVKRSSFILLRPKNRPRVKKGGSKNHLFQFLLEVPSFVIQSQIKIRRMSKACGVSPAPYHPEQYSEQVFCIKNRNFTPVSMKGRWTLDS